MTDVLWGRLLAFSWQGPEFKLASEQDAPTEVFQDPSSGSEI